MSQTAVAENPPEEQPFLAFVRRYKKDPVGFVREVLLVDPDPWQAEFLNAIAAGERRLSVRSGHGIGKTAAASWAALWYLLFHYPVKIVITAPTASQLFDALFAELRRWAKSLPPALADLLEATTDRVVLKASPTEAFISARTSSRERPESLAGVHSEHVMLICDEASGIPEEVFESAAGSMSGDNAVTILLGNPTRNTGTFFDSHHRLKEEWWTRHVSCLNSSRVSPDFIRDIIQRYGEGSNATKIRLYGEFASAEDDSLISRDLITSAMKRDIQVDPLAPLVFGVDPARFGSDRTALCKRKGNVILEVKTWRNLDLMETCGRIVNEFNSLPFDQRPVEILVDSIGLGGGVVDRLRELGYPCRGINVSEASALHNGARMRDDLWIAIKEWLETRTCRLPDDETILTDLSAPRYTFTSSGKLKVESKDEMRRRGLASPDTADAIGLTFASTAATISGGTKVSWGKPIRRNLKGLV